VNGLPGDRVRVALDGVRPPGWIVLHSLAKPLRAVEGDARARPAEDARRVWLPDSLAAIVLRY